MKKLYYRISIEASAEEVWKVLWGEHTYLRWASAFSDDSQVQTDWQEGSKALFVNSDGDGIASKIIKSELGRCMLIRHTGMINKGIEDYTSEKSKEWAGAEESYFLQEVEGHTELLVEADTTDEYEDFFSNTWPKALQIIKSLSEEAFSLKK